MSTDYRFKAFLQFYSKMLCSKVDLSKHLFRSIQCWYCPRSIQQGSGVSLSVFPTLWNLVGIPPWTRVFYVDRVFCRYPMVWVSPPEVFFCPLLKQIKRFEATVPFQRCLNSTQQRTPVDFFQQDFIKAPGLHCHRLKIKVQK